MERVLSEGMKAGGEMRSKKRKWPVTAVGLLLIFQSIFLVCIFPFLLGLEFWGLPQMDLAVIFPESGGIAPISLDTSRLEELAIDLRFDTVTIPIESPKLFSLLFATLALPLLVTGFLFLITWRHAWTIALFFQVIALSLALLSYFRFHHPYDYLVMFYSIILVFYLNYFEVQEVFRLPVSEVSDVL